MRLQKITETSTKNTHIYHVNHDKRILLHTGPDRSIDMIVLLNLDITKLDPIFKPKGLWYLENVTEGDDCEILNTDLLMIMIAQEEHGCVRA